MAFQTRHHHVRIFRSKQNLTQNLERLSSMMRGFRTLCQIGLVIFPRVTQLDLTGPVQVFSSVPGAKVHLIWKRIEPVPSDSVLTLTPTITFADCPQLDVICVPGGLGTDDMINDEEMLDFLRKQAVGAKIHHLGLYGVAGAGRGRPAAGLPGGDALDGDGFSWRVRRDADEDARLHRP